MTLSPPPVTLPDTELHTLSSAFVAQTFSVFVALPHTYMQDNKTYPVLYALDANANFGIVSGIVRSLVLSNTIPDMIVVGIGYPVRTHKEAQSLRTRDLTPTATDWYETRLHSFLPDAPPSVGSGGAAHFLRFVREELIPFVDARYRTQPAQRALLGFSFGGLFALYTLFNQPQTFRIYCAGSPSIWWDERTLLSHEKMFAAQHDDVAAKLFLSCAEHDFAYLIGDMYKLADALRSRHYQSLQLTTRFFDGETHSSNFPAFASWALRAAYGQKS